MKEKVSGRIASGVPITEEKGGLGAGTCIGKAGGGRKCKSWPILWRAGFRKKKRAQERLEVAGECRGGGGGGGSCRRLKKGKSCGS